jgi:hypothetical protein
MNPAHVPGHLRQLYTFLLQLLALLSQQFFLFLMLFNFFLEDISNRLVGAWIEVVGQDHLLAV